MTHQQELMLATLKGRVDGQMIVAKAEVRAAFQRLPCEEHPYGRGYRDSHRRKTVQHLRAIRDIQRYVDEFCKGVGCHA